MKEKLQKSFRKFLQRGFVYTLVCLVLGLLLVIWPMQAVPGVIVAILLSAAIIGIAQIIYYFISPADIAAENLSLTKGLIAIETVGIACFYYFARPELSFVIYIFSMAIMSSVRFQSSTDMARRKFKIWYVFLIIAIVLLLLCLMPFLFKIDIAWLHRIIGISLLIEFVDDFICRLILTTNN